MSEKFEYFCKGLRKESMSKNLYFDKRVDADDWQYELRKAYSRRYSIWTDPMKLYEKAIALNTLFYHLDGRTKPTMRNFLKVLEETDIYELKTADWYEGAVEATIYLIIDSFRKTWEKHVAQCEREVAKLMKESEKEEE